METKDDKTMIDRLRLRVLTSAELFDAWRVVPRLLVAAYGWLCWEIVRWYMGLKPSIIEGCNIENLAELCLYDAPTTQHAALVTVIVGASAAVFGLYTNTGRSWSKGGFVKWDDTNMQRTSRSSSYPQRSYGQSDVHQPEMGNYENRGNMATDYQTGPDEEGFWDDTQR